MENKSSLTIIVLFLTTVVRCKIFSNTNNPKIEISHWIQNSKTDSWKNGIELDEIEYNSTVYYIPKYVYILALHCTANYPIHFTFKHLQAQTKILDQSSLWSYMYMFTKIYRSSPHLEDPTTYKFGAVQFLYGDSPSVSGNYVCQSADFANFQTNMNIFWEGSNPRYLLNSGTTQQVTTHGTSGEIILPCILSVHQDQVVLSLLREIETTTSDDDTEFAEFDGTHSNVKYTYDPFRGYVLTFDFKASVEGRYKCATSQQKSSTKEIEDFVIVDVIAEPIRPPEQYKEIVSPDASLAYNEKQSILTCCSNSTNPPKVLVLPCSDYVSCKTTQRFLETVCVDGNYFSNAEKNGSCSNHYIYKGTAVLFRCTGDGIDVIRRIIFSIDQRNQDGTPLFEVYSKWSDIVPENLIRIIPDNLGDDQYSIRSDTRMYFFYPQFPEYKYNSKFYAGQNVSFRCDTSPYYFSDGAKMTVRFANNSTDSATQCMPEFDVRDIAKTKHLYHSFHIRHRNIILAMNMTSVTCHAPVWNSKKWVQKSFDFHVWQPILPAVVGDSEEIVYFNLTSDEPQSIRCEITAGDPHPVLKWMRQGKEVKNNANIRVRSTNTSIALKFVDVLDDVEGTYVCVATSPLFGHVEKRFHVYLEETDLWRMVVVLVLFALAVVAIIGYVIGRVTWQRRGSAESTPMAGTPEPDHDGHEPNGNGTTEEINPELINV